MKYLLIALFFISYLANGQVGIGTDTPKASAKWDVTATNKGFLPPRISLLSATDVITISSPATGLLVYCVGDAGLAAGYYFWNGSSWEKLSLSSELDTKANLSGATFTGALNSDASITIGNSEGNISSSNLILNPTNTIDEGGEILFKKPINGWSDWNVDVYQDTFRIFAIGAGNEALKIYNNNQIVAHNRFNIYTNNDWPLYIESTASDLNGMIRLNLAL